MGWHGVPMPGPPLYLADPEKRFRAVPLPDLDAMYVQLRAHSDGPEESLTRFTQSVDAALAEQQPRNLVVDLRFDVGGNPDRTRAWIKTLPPRVPGRIYLLVGTYTFSAGIVSSAALKHDGAGKTRVVGDELGDRLIWWSEGDDVCLPSSHYCLHRTTGMWNLIAGCKGHAGCYGDKHDVVVGTLKPDIRAPLTAAAWLAGRDPGMDAVRAAIGRR